jgi:GNAT superfamily N-acetyltransferase
VTAIDYRIGGDLELDDVRDLYVASTLGRRRPIDDEEIFEQMFAYANLIVTAWDGELLVGISRALTDFGHVCYLADLAVRESHQKMGIGVELVRRTRAALGPKAMIVLLAAPAAVDYYPRIGFNRHESAWILMPGDALENTRPGSP